MRRSIDFPLAGVGAKVGFADKDKVVAEAREGVGAVGLRHLKSR